MAPHFFILGPGRSGYKFLHSPATFRLRSTVIDVDMRSITLLFVLLALGAIDAAPKNSNPDQLAGYNPYEENETLLGRKTSRNFGVLQLGGGYGVAKRVAQQSNKEETNAEKHRRGPLNGLIPGGAFGRAARSNCARKNCEPVNYDKIIRLLKSPIDMELQPYVSFDVEDRMDGYDGQGVRAFIDKTLQENMASNDVYTPYQYKQLLGIE